MSFLMLHIFVGAIAIGLLFAVFSIARELLASRPEALRRFSRGAALGDAFRDRFGKLASFRPAKEEVVEPPLDDSLVAERAAARMARIRARSVG